MNFKNFENNSYNIINLIFYSIHSDYNLGYLSANSDFIFPYHRIEIIHYFSTENL